MRCGAVADSSSSGAVADSSSMRSARSSGSLVVVPELFASALAVLGTLLGAAVAHRYQEKATVRSDMLTRGEAAEQACEAFAVRAGEFLAAEE